MCQNGQNDVACGDDGFKCINCSTNPDDQQCVNDAMGGTCGCNDSAHCATYEACSAAHLCGVSCGGPATCHGGCCNGGSCVMGTANDSCGSNGGACTDCTIGCPGMNGDICVSGSGNYCGCGSAGDCSGCGSHNKCNQNGNTQCGS